ncbi:hypothetical protein C3L33_11558, partial [Rhododendron williamsianum]
MRRSGAKQIAFFYSDSSKEYLTMEDLVKLVTEKVEPLMGKHKEIEQMQDEVLRTCADMVKLVTQKEVLLKRKHKDIEKKQDKVLRTCADMVNVAEEARDDAEVALIQFPIMLLSWISSRVPRIVLAQCRNSFEISSRHRPLPVPSNQFHSLGESRHKVLRH